MDSLVALTVLFLAACATTSGLVPVSPMQRVEFDGFSILPPAGEGWLAVNPPIQPENTLGIRTRAYFIKRLSEPSPPPRLHRLTAVVRTVDVGDKATGDRREALRSIASGFSGRSRLDKCLGWDCASYASTTEDAANPSFPGHVFVIDKRGFFVFHPDSPRLVVNIEYRQYHGRDVQPLTTESLEREVEPFQRSLKLAKGARRNGQNVPVESLEGNLPGRLATPADLPAPIVTTPPDLGLHAAQREREEDALKILDECRAIRGTIVDEDLYRGYKLALAAADRILGYKRGGLPMPGLGARLTEATVEQRTIRMRWADGRVVSSGLVVPSGPVQAMRMPAERGPHDECDDE